MLAMRLLDDLRAEHELIERVLGSLRTYATRFVAGAACPADGVSFISFLEEYAGEWHHEKEEDVLFPALVSEAMLPVERGPLAVLLDDHNNLSLKLSAMSDALLQSDRETFAELAMEYTAALWLHIDVENSVLFPESEQQLRRQGIYELPSPEIPPQVVQAAVVAADLLARYPAAESPDAVRGEGCVICPAYTFTCRGLEREWWNDWQWEELDEHVAAS